MTEGRSTAEGAGGGPRGAETRPRGLTSAEVAERVARGQTNAGGEPASESVSRILARNIFTRFNAILGVLLVVILVFGHARDALFGIVLITNAAIGIVQELRAKQTLDRLAVATAPVVTVWRDGQPQSLPAEQLVCDDVLELHAGDAVPVDGDVLESRGLELDESLLTGESRTVPKAPADEVRSGTFVAAGDGLVRATQVGAQAYARQLSAEARRYGLVRSELRDGVDQILRWVVWAMVPAGAIIIFGELRGDRSFTDAVTSIVAALVGMIPQGLVLLTSLAFAVSVVALGRRNALVQELPAVEGLARIDVLCLDKTGTLTEPTLEAPEPTLLPGAPVGLDAVRDALGALARVEERPNRTLQALHDAFPDPRWSVVGSTAFSSARKWSAAAFAEHGAWVLGAPDVLLAEDTAPAVRARDLAATGVRVLLLAEAPPTPAAAAPAPAAPTPALPTPDAPPRDLTPVALVALRERIRPDARKTLAYFAAEGVAIKVFSGDDPATVADVLHRVGVDPGTPVDARHLPADDEALAEELDAHTVFGRVVPEQKREMVRALQARGHVVGMTGDGVNDTLALKQADLGIAMGSGAQAARAVARVVLLDDRFATLPHLVAEGRRVLANVERVANLYVTKTAYAILLAVVIGLVAVPYPLLPRQLSVVASLTIGIPSFFLGLAPNTSRYRPGFVPRVLRFTIPAGMICGLATLVVYLPVLSAGLPLDAARTIATVVLTLVALWVLALVSRPLTGWRLALVAAMAAGLALVLAVPPVREFFALPIPSARHLGWLLGVVLGAGIALQAFVREPVGGRPR